MKRGTLLLPLLAALPLCFGACARHESATEREAEINRRVQQQLAAEREARGKQELAQRAAALADRERELASREAFLATVSASLLKESAPSFDASEESQSDGEPIDTEPALSSSYIAPEPVYPEPANYLLPNETVLAWEPAYGAPIIPSLTVVYQSTAFITINRLAHRHHGGNHMKPLPMPSPPRMMIPRSGPAAPRPATPSISHHLPIVAPVVHPLRIAPRSLPRAVANKAIKTNPN